jgi:membrane-associated phospholipid phosphatase
MLLVFLPVRREPVPRACFKTGIHPPAEYYFIGLGFSLLFYVVLPKRDRFRPAVVGTDALTLLIAYIFSIDSPTMVFPSMHVFCAAATHAALARHWRGSGRRGPAVLSFFVMVLICVSTVFVKQHSVLDILSGALLAVVLYLLVYRREKQTVPVL